MLQLCFSLKLQKYFVDEETSPDIPQTTAEVSFFNWSSVLETDMLQTDC